MSIELFFSSSSADHVVGSLAVRRSLRQSPYSPKKANVFGLRRSTNSERQQPLYPMPSSSGDSSGVPQRRQMTAEQSPQVNGSPISTAQTGQYNNR